MTCSNVLKKNHKLSLNALKGKRRLALKIIKKLIVLVVFLIFGLTGCGGGGSGSGSNSDPHGSRDFLVGVAPIPRNYPGTQADWQDMFDKIQEVGELATAQSDWRDSVDTSGTIPEFIALLGNQKNTYHYEPVYGINFFQQSGNYDPILNVKTDPTNDWTNADAKALYQKVALDICATYHPRYLGLAVEVNSYYLKHTADFNRFVFFYKELYDLIKAAYPDTKVFVTFQLEMMKGLGDAI